MHSLTKLEPSHQIHTRDVIFCSLVGLVPFGRCSYLLFAIGEGFQPSPSETLTDLVRFIDKG